MSWNNKTYARLNDRLTELRPYFEKEDYQVFNCNPDSKLTAFDHLPFEEALKRAQTDFGNIDLAKERTLGLYDHNTKQKRRGTGKDLITRQKKVAGQRKTARKKAAKKKTARSTKR